MLEHPAHRVGDGPVVDGDDFVDVRLDVAEGDVAGAHGEQAVGDPADLVERDRRSPAASERVIRGAPDGSTPMTRTCGARLLMAVDTPASRPPPLHGT